MTHKTNKDLKTIISTVKGVRIILDREHQVSILENHPNRPGVSSLAQVENDDEADESYNPSDEEKDEAGAQNMIPIDACQIEIQTTFEQLQTNQELAHQKRASIDRQEVMLAHLWQRFMPDQGSSRRGGTDFGPQYGLNAHIEDNVIVSVESLLAFSVFNLLF
ncbi:hypothetical protein M9H77_26715 [Catharanthus roseus]|uniref:Uncharacterized protein n=1 Tax=Catharanthus roseus TaxID=4058 RepID=A0ACC0ABV6_CATRO|nr:hypothetical protein M9H77_26715 [Catharanthus roseus]